MSLSWSLLTLLFTTPPAGLVIHSHPQDLLSLRAVAGGGGRAVTLTSLLSPPALSQECAKYKVSTCRDCIESGPGCAWCQKLVRVASNSASHADGPYGWPVLTGGRPFPSHLLGGTPFSALKLPSRPHPQSAFQWGRSGPGARCCQRDRQTVERAGPQAAWQRQT